MRAWQHPAGPFLTKQRFSWVVGTPGSVVEEELSSDSSDEDSGEEAKSKTTGASQWTGSGAWKRPRSARWGSWRREGNSGNSCEIGRSCKGACPARCSGRIGRQPRRTEVEIWVCTHSASIVSSRLYNCTEPPVWCPWICRSLCGNRSCAATDSIETLREWRVKFWAELDDNRGRSHGVWQAHLSARRAAA